MTLQQLKYVESVARIGSISQASNELFISQPSLTSAIKELEKEIGFEIFTRTNKGVTTSNLGNEFLGYARQVLQQASILEEKYLKNQNYKFTQNFCVSTQHYSFVVKAFSLMVRDFDFARYDFNLRETQTFEIINDVSLRVSELGVLYKTKSNEIVIDKLLKKNNLEFEKIITAEPHVFIGQNHPLSKKEIITLEDLQDFAYLTFEQGQQNSFYFSEEFLNLFDHKKNIKVTDRATMTNLIVALNGFTVSSGIVNEDINGTSLISRKLDCTEEMEIGVIKRKNETLSSLAENFLEKLKASV